MADYIEILNTQIEPKAPVTSELLYQNRDNPIAVAEGKVDAPRVVSRALGLSYMTASGTYNETTLDSVDMGEAGYDIILVQAYGAYTSLGGGASTVQLQGSNDASSWTPLVDVLSSSLTDVDTVAGGSVVYNGNGGTEYQYYRIHEGGDSDKEFEGMATAIFIGGDTS